MCTFVFQALSTCSLRLAVGYVGTAWSSPTIQTALKSCPALPKQTGRRIAWSADAADCVLRCQPKRRCGVLHSLPNYQSISLSDCSDVPRNDEMSNDRRFLLTVVAPERTQSSGSQPGRCNCLAQTSVDLTEKLFLVRLCSQPIIWGWPSIMSCLEMWIDAVLVFQAVDLKQRWHFSLFSSRAFFFLSWLERAFERMAILQL